MLFSGQLLAADWADHQAVDAAVQRFVEVMNRGDVAGAHREFRGHLGVAADSFDSAVKETLADMGNLRQQLGSPLGMVLIERQTIGNEFYRHIYLQKYASAAIVWDLMFYRPENSWKVVGVSYSADVDRWFRRMDK